MSATIDHQTVDAVQTPARVSRRKRLVKPLRLKNPIRRSNGSKNGHEEKEQPAAILRVQVISGSGLIALDRGGTTSDPFVTVNVPPNRHSTKVVKRSLEPEFPAASSTFDFPLFRGQAGLLGAIECVAWDKDMLRKEYLGEAAVQVADWFPNSEPVEWSPDLEPVTAPLVSSRRRKKATGHIKLRIGFVSAGDSTAESKGAPTVDFRTAYDYLLKRSEERNILTVPAFKGIGTTKGRSGENGDDSDDSASSASELQDDGLSSDSSSDEDEGDDSPASAPTSAPPSPRNKLRELPSSSSVPRTSANGLLLPSLGSAALGVPAVTSASSTTTLNEPSSSSGSLPTPRRGSTPALAKPTRKGSGDSYFDLSEGASSSEPGRRRRKFRRSKKSTKEFSYSTDSEILGVVLLEIKGAEDLPRLKNAFKIGFDMDPFVVVSFGKKIFRTRVIRHELNPKWDEKLLFHCKKYESSYTIKFSILDWDKASGNDFVGETTLPLAELLNAAPRPDPKTGLHESDGRGDMKEFKLHLETPQDPSWQNKHNPFITIRAKYEPYEALRQRFWRELAKQYDEDGSGRISLTELETMLDSLGSTLTKQTIDSYFTQQNLSPETDELTIEQLIQALEGEVKKRKEDKNRVRPEENDMSSGSGAVTPSLQASDATPSLELLDGQSRPNPAIALGVDGPAARPAQDPAVAELDRPAVVGNGLPKNEVPVTDEAGIPYDDDDENEIPEESEHLERVINVKECPLCHRPRLSKRSEVDIVTHIAVCASADWNSINRILVGNYVTASQAQRKTLTKIFTKVSSGAYRIGANSANILVQDRVSGHLLEEKMAVYVRLGIRVLYKGAKSQMQGARARRMLKSMSFKQGLKYDSPESAAEIPAFIAFHRLNMDEVLNPLESFRTFNEFFYRKLKPEVRPICQDPEAVVSIADCRLMAFDTVSSATKLWIKGRDFTIEKLLGPYGGEAAKFSEGAVGIFRLAPQDYHRFHVPVDGKIGKIFKVEGAYYTVNPQAIRTALDVYGENVRTVVPIDSPLFGRVFVVCVGAMMVGSIGHSVQEGELVRRGDELGYFAFGGSTCILLMENGKVEWDEDLRLNCQASLETLVQYGTKIGHRVQAQPQRPALDGKRSSSSGGKASVPTV